MLWIGAGSLIIIFFSIRAYLNNVDRRRMRIFPQQFPKTFFFLMQLANILCIFAGVLFLMLAIVSHIKGFQIIFSSEFEYYMRLIPNP
ncbi:MAG TPA: hypothetical protein VF181_01950 [Balneolaceae bacterium]